MTVNNVSSLFSDVLNGKDGARIKLLGDSITHGVGGSGWEQKGDVIVPGWAESPNSYCWATLFRDYMKEKYGAVVLNKACTGTTVEFIIDNFNALVDDGDDIIVCTIGTNNRHQYFDQGEKKTVKEMSEGFYKNLKKLHGMLLERGKKVVFVANIPASEQNECDGENYWRILHMCDINDIYKRFATESGVPFFSLYDAFSKYCENSNVSADSLLCDGLHPNDEGYRVMFELIVNAFGL